MFLFVCLFACCFSNAEGAGNSAVWTDQRAFQTAAHQLLLPAANEDVSRSLPKTILQG